MIIFISISTISPEGGTPRGGDFDIKVTGVIIVPSDENELEPRPQDEILVPFRGSFQNFRRSPSTPFIWESPPGGFPYKSDGGNIIVMSGILKGSLYKRYQNLALWMLLEFNSTPSAYILKQNQFLSYNFTA